VVLWAMCRLINHETLPDRRVVVRFELRDLPKHRYWLILDPAEAEVCVKFPGFDDDLVVTTDSLTLAKWHMGWITLSSAVDRELIAIEGPPTLVRAFPTWGGYSKFADVHPVRESTYLSGGDGWKPARRSAAGG